MRGVYIIRGCEVVSYDIYEFRRQWNVSTLNLLL